MIEGDGFIYPPVGSADIRRDLYVTSVGHGTYAPGEAYPRAGHPGDYEFRWRDGRVLGDFAVVLIEQGEGEFEDRSLGRVAWRAGEVLLLPPGQWHRYRPGRASGWTESWLCINGNLPHRLRDHGVFPRTCLLRHLGDAAPCAASIARVRSAAVAGNSLLLAARALETLALALEAREVRHRGVEPAAGGDPLVDRGLEFIALNSHRPILVDTVAAAVGATRRTLERAFARAHERTIAEEILRQRLDRARLLLRESSMSVKEIGYAAGFGGAQGLHRAFRAAYGVTPLAFRRDDPHGF